MVHIVVDCMFWTPEKLASKNIRMIMGGWGLFTIIKWAFVFVFWDFVRRTKGSVVVRSHVSIL